MKKFAQNHPFWFFYIIAFVLFQGGIALGVMLMPDFMEVSMAKMEELGLNHGNVIITILLMFENPIWILGLIIPGAPAIAAVIATKVIGKPGAMKELFCKFNPVGEGISGKEALKQYGILLVYAILVISAGLAYSYFVYGESGLQTSLNNLRANSPLLMVGMFLLAVFTEEGALLEELGWRGYALPILMKRLKTPLNAAIVLGIAWSFWHFGRNVLSLIFGMPFGDWILTEINFLTSIIASTIVIVYFVNRLGGSIIPAIFLHGLGNYWFNYIFDPEVPVYYLGFEFDTILRVLGASIILIIAGKQLGLRGEKLPDIQLDIKSE
ncbi:MAG TPA: CPBP family intramembrane metalloprotease [Thermotogaceae bacterium]|nr:CPBP family intramembrane metalloprotease [Thermotogaceae bacterium]